MAFTLALLLNGLEQLYAQDRTITGTIKSSDDQYGLPGANIVIDGTQSGTVTDADGHYSISVPTGATLIFSSIGYKTQKIVVSTQSVIDVVLEPDVAALDEVVVVGYGTVDKRDLTVPVSSVSAKQLKDIPINSAAQALAGRLAGVQVTGSEGSPNASVQIRVRGGGSITQDNSPIYVVDGVQVDNALSVIAPQDIESIDVLKDASATAIYGARGSNGVVIITTKGGKEMKTTVSFNSLYGVQELANKLDVMKPYDFVSYQYERSRGSSTGEDGFLSTYGHYEDLENYKQVPFVDWQDKTFGRSAKMSTNNVSITGGSAASQFSLSVTENKQEGVMLYSGFDRKLVNFRFDHNVSKRLKVGFNVRYNNTVVKGAGTSTPGSSSLNRLRHSVKYRPFLFPGQSVDTYDPNYAAETNANSLSLVNPVLLSKAEYKKTTTSVANINGYVSFDITKDINFRSTFGYDVTSGRENVFNDTITSVSKLNGANQPIASIKTTLSEILNNSNVITFSTAKINSPFTVHNRINFMIGQELYQTRSQSNFLESHLFPVGITPELAFGSMALGTPQIPTSSDVTSKLLSYFTRLNYSYDDKYLLTLTMRRDGSSKFAPKHRWGNFPSAALAWRISNETFMENIKGTVSDLKLRLSTGVAGNNRINDFLYLSQFEAYPPYEASGSQVIGYGPKRDNGNLVLPNSNLQWERTSTRNIGVDVGLFSNRIQFSVDVYSNNVNKLLLAKMVPSTSGYASQSQNVGKTSNKGIEFQVSGTPISSGKLQWNVNFNLSHNVNKVVSLAGQSSFLAFSGWGGSAAPADYVVKEGQPVGLMWGLVTDGFYKVEDFDYENGVYTLKNGVANDKSITALDPKPGVIKFKDRTGDGLVDDKDRTVIGHSAPKFFGGLNNQFTYRNFDLSVFVNFQYGNQILNANKLEFTSGYTPNSNMLTMMNQRWRNVDAEGQVVTDPQALQALNANAKIWSPLTSASSFYPHSWAVEDGSFLRINNITLGYNIPASILSKARISKLRFYTTVNNLAVFSHYSGYDPEVNTRTATSLTPGVDYAAYPRSHTYIFGLNLTF